MRQGHQDGVAESFEEETNAQPRARGAAPALEFPPVKDQSSVLLLMLLFLAMGAAAYFYAQEQAAKKAAANPLNAVITLGKTVASIGSLFA